jgi:undecaprenyl-diphosphatase
MPTPPPSLSLHHAVALGLLHGPTELLPVSSSGHTTLVPWLAGWPYNELDPRARKSFEVALHAGTAAALLLRPPVSRLSARPSFLAPAVLPAAMTGYAFGAHIERRFGTPATIAVGLLAGSLAAVAADVRPGGLRSEAEAGARDGLVLGLAQALALAPGVSRSGASLAAARARGFSRANADRLSWTAGLPVIAGATLLQGSKLAREGIPRGLGLPLAAGATGAFLSTLASTSVLSPNRRVALLPACAAYRVALAALVIRRTRDNTRQRLRHPSIPK